MPYITGKNKKGNWIKWGTKGKKYYYIPGNVNSRERAKKKAQKQAAAIIANRKKGAR